LITERIQSQQVITGNGDMLAVFEGGIHYPDYVTGGPVVLPMRGLVAISS
jgi:hypothetical protein